MAKANSNVKLRVKIGAGKTTKSKPATAAEQPKPLPPHVWMQTSDSKKLVLPVEKEGSHPAPDFSGWTIQSLADMLAKVNRFGGATMVPYSVAQHSVLVSQIVEMNGGSIADQKRALFHDAKETIIGDMTAPAKKALPAYVRRGLAEYEARIDAAIFKQFGVSQHAMYTGNADPVRQADLCAAATEARDLLFGGPLEGWASGYDLPKPIPFKVEPMQWRDAAHAFIDRYVQLCDKEKSEPGCWGYFTGEGVAFHVGHIEITPPICERKRLRQTIAAEVKKAIAKSVNKLRRR